MASEPEPRTCGVCQAPMPADEVVRFTHRGTTYEVDLCAPHVRKLDKVLAEFVAGGRVVDGG